MILDVANAKANEGTAFSFEGKREISSDILLEDKAVTPLSYTGTYLIFGGALIIEGHARMTLSATCDRCAAKMQYDIKFDFADKFDEDDTEYRINESEFKLGEYLDEQVVLNMPSKRLCKEDCKGLCNVCGANLNLTKCDCKPYADESNPFYELSLKFKNKDK